MRIDFVRHEDDGACNPLEGQRAGNLERRESRVEATSIGPSGLIPTITNGRDYSAPRQPYQKGPCVKDSGTRLRSSASHYSST
jgi:hypothetical protein